MVNHSQCSIYQKSSGGRALKARESRRRRRQGRWGLGSCEGCPLPHRGRHVGRGLCPLPRKFFIFFHFKIVHCGAFSYTNTKVLFAIKCRERYVIMVFLAIDSGTDKSIKFSSVS